MSVLAGLGLGLVLAVAICGIALFGAICVGILKEREDEKKDKKEKEEDK